MKKLEKESYKEEKRYQIQSNRRGTIEVAVASSLEVVGG